MVVSSSRPSDTSPSPQAVPLPSIQEANNKQFPKEKEPRRSSLGHLLRRTKSNSNMGSKKERAALWETEERLRREAVAIPQAPPRLPNLYNGAAPPRLPYSEGDERPDPIAMVSGKVGGQYQGRETNMGVIPVPPIPQGVNNGRTGEFVDPYARTESMTHRGRYSYASSAVSTINSPRRVRRRKDPTPFNILIIGARSSGKTSFLNFLKTSLALPAKKRGGNKPTELIDDIFAPQSKMTGNFESHYLETEIDNERIGLTLWDSEGLEKNAVDLQLRVMSSFLQNKFEDTFNEEMKVVRAPGVQDTHIHCAFLILDPVRLDQNLAAAKKSQANGNGTSRKYSDAPRILGGLDEDLDLQVLRTLQGMTTVVPVISKADTITTAHMQYLKKTVWDSLRQANLDPLEALGLDDFEPESPRNASRIDEGEEDENDSSSGRNSDDLPIQTPDKTPEKPLTTDQSSPRSNRLSSSGSVRRHKRAPSEDASQEQPYLPLSIISPDMYEPDVIGRKFPWGFADPMNVDHCDFIKLKEAVFSEWRGELREASRDLWYEGWRTSRLKHRGGSGGLQTRR
ncbi:hypothetical protein BJ878DRAFT_22121 [Calycina marina]|uniref:Septin-type G domain-containing protein n=1 Tax=Calycina marina TaxID=1763456 RepID=A0A9P7Z5Q5_9HELO|nr:hypothetical protein BJ878DRAFT_22121 [Calycina marina]